MISTRAARLHRLTDRIFEKRSLGLPLKRPPITERIPGLRSVFVFLQITCRSNGIIVRVPCRIRLRVFGAAGILGRRSGRLLLNFANDRRYNDLGLVHLLVNRLDLVVNIIGHDLFEIGFPGTGRLFGKEFRVAVVIVRGDVVRTEFLVFGSIGGRQANVCGHWCDGCRASGTR